MPAPRKYPDELRERAIRLVLDIEEETGNTNAACRRVGEELGINPDTLRGARRPASMKGASAFSSLARFFLPRSIS